MKNSTPLPKAASGYALASLQAVLSLLDISLQHRSGTAGQTWSLTLNIFTSIFILLYIYRLHQMAEEQTQGSYDITAGKAVGFSFIPFYNIYWFFHWTGKMIGHINEHLNQKKISKLLPVLLFLSALILSVIPFRMGDRYLSLGVPFLWIGFLAYLGKKLSHCHAEESGVSVKRDQIPFSFPLGYGKEQVFHVLPALFILSSTILFFFTTDGRFLDPRNLINLLLQIIPLVLVALGFLLVMKRGYVDLSIGSMMGLSSVVFALIKGGVWLPAFSYLGLSFPVSVLFTLLMGLVLGGIQGVLIGYVKLPSYIVTLGGLFVFYRLALVITQGHTIRLQYAPGGFSRFLGVNPMTLFFVLGIGMIGVSAFLLPLWLKDQAEKDSSSREKGGPSAKDTVLRFILLGGFTSMAGIFMAYRMQGGLAVLGQGNELYIMLACLISGALYYQYQKSFYMVILGTLLVGIFMNGLSLMNRNLIDQKLLMAGLLCLIALLHVLLDKGETPVLIMVSLGIAIGAILQLPVMEIIKQNYGLKIYQQWVIPVFILIGGLAGQWLWPKGSEKQDDSPFL